VKISNIIKSCFSLNKRKQDKVVESFTYYVPAPNKRDTGYREKEFDRIFTDFINRGYQIIEIKVVSSSDQQQSGFWFICIVESLSSNKREELISPDEGEKEQEQIEGLYYFD